MHLYHAAGGGGGSGSDSARMPSWTDHTPLSRERLEGTKTVHGPLCGPTGVGLALGTEARPTVEPTSQLSPRRHIPGKAKQIQLIVRIHNT